MAPLLLPRYGGAKKNTKKPLKIKGLKKAADGNRTRDLRTTNATLYRLSHSSLFHLVALANLVYIIMGE